MTRSRARWCRMAGARGLPPWQAPDAKAFPIFFVDLSIFFAGRGTIRAGPSSRGAGQRNRKAEDRHGRTPDHLLHRPLARGAAGPASPGRSPHHACGPRCGAAGAARAIRPTPSRNGGSPTDLSSNASPRSPGHILSGIIPGPPRRLDCPPHANPCIPAPACGGLFCQLPGFPFCHIPLPPSRAPARTPMPPPR